MTAQEAKSYLMTARASMARLDALTLERERILSTAVGGAHMLDGMPRGGVDPRDPGKLDVLADMLTDIGTEVAEHRWRVRQVQDTIQHVTDITHRSLLEYRYICGLTWEQIAGLLNYGLRSVYYIHGRALQDVCIVLQSKP